MKTNVGSVDRILRIVVGIVLVVLAAAGAIGAWGYIGVLPIVTGAIGWCPGYLPLGINTCKTKHA